MARDPAMVDGLPSRPIAEPEQRRGGRGTFIAINIPVAWVVAALRARGGGVIFGLLLQYGLARRRPFQASLAKLTLGCVSIDTARRAIAALEAARLIRVDRAAGRRNRFTIVGPGIPDMENHNDQSPV